MTDPCPKSGVSLHELISTFKKTKKTQVGNELSNILPKLLHARKKPPPPPHSDRLIAKMDKKGRKDNVLITVFVAPEQRRSERHDRKSSELSTVFVTRCDVTG